MNIFLSCMAVTTLRVHRHQCTVYSSATSVDGLNTLEMTKTMMTAVDSVWKIWRQLTDLLWVVYRFFAVALPPSTGVLLWLPQRRVHRRGKGFCLTRQIVSLESLFDESVQLLLAVVRNHDNHRALFNPIDYSTHPNAYLSVRLAVPSFCLVSSCFEHSWIVSKNLNLFGAKTTFLFNNDLENFNSAAILSTVNGA